MNAHVSFQMPHLGKRVRAHRALKRLLSRVNPNVRSHVGGLVACISAVGAVVEYFPCACWAAPLMSSGLAEGTPAVPNKDGR